VKRLLTDVLRQPLVLVLGVLIGMWLGHVAHMFDSKVQDDGDYAASAGVPKAWCVVVPGWAEERCPAGWQRMDIAPQSSLNFCCRGRVPQSVVSDNELRRPELRDGKGRHLDMLTW